MIKWLRMGEDRWIIQRKNKTYPITDLESLFAYSLAFDLKFDEIEKAVLEMHRKNHNVAEFENRRFKMSGVR